MTREELTTTFLLSTSRNFILQLPTSYGKTRLALQKTEQWYKKDCKILVVIPRLILIKSWKEELKKWGYERFLDNITFSTYISLPLHCDGTWDVVIFDEGHHTSDRCMECMKDFYPNHIIILSATLKKEHIKFFKNKYNPEIIQVKVKEAIQDEVLPDPRLILIPLTLDNKRKEHFIEKNFKKDKPNNSWITVDYNQKWKYRSYKNPLRIRCTQQQYYNDLSGLIDWYKQRGKSSAVMKNMHLHKSLERLKWLAKQKETIVKDILKELRYHRTLVFCPSIEDSSKLNSPCINSKVGTANLELFNSKKIKHIAAVGMLDEGELAPISI